MARRPRRFSKVPLTVRLDESLQGDLDLLVSAYDSSPSGVVRHVIHKEATEVRARTEAEETDSLPDTAGKDLGQE